MDIERLSHLPEKKRRELQRIAQILFDKFDESLKTKLSEKAKRGRILKLILFGSYARGNWVEDRKSGYLSDYDLLIVVNYEQFAEKYDAWEKAAARFAQEFEIAGHLSAPVNFIVHSYEEVNSLLARGWPFFVDIARDGIPLYEAPDHPLASPKNLAPEEARAEARWRRLCIPYVVAGGNSPGSSPAITTRCFRIALMAPGSSACLDRFPQRSILRKMLPLSMRAAIIHAFNASTGRPVR